MAKKTYDEASITKLKGIEPVKLLPGMYTRVSDPTHIIQEAIDNAADEAYGGHATRIDVTGHKDGSAAGGGNGRGVPIGMHPTEKIPTVQLVFTELHAGAKFYKRSGDAAYQFSGGLHGVGVSVTNALSERLEVEIKREGAAHRIVFADGDVKEKLKKVGAAKGTGTELRIWPNKKYFDSPKVSMPALERLVRSKAVLLPGVTVTLAVEGSKDGTRTWKYPEGMTGYLNEMLTTQELQAVAPVVSAERYVEEANGFAKGEGAGWALAFIDGEDKGFGESYANLIPTPAGGTHESGMRDGVFEAVKSFAEHHSMMPRGIKLLPDDVWSRAVYFLSAKLLEPQFHGQTKEKLSNRDALKLVSGMVRDPPELWMNTHVEHGRKI